MKRICFVFLLLFTALYLFSCKENYEIDTECDFTVRNSLYSEKDTRFETKFTQVKKRKPILSAKEAVEYAESLMFSDSADKVFDGLSRDSMTVIGVMFDAEEYIWMVTFGRKQDLSSGVATIGGERNIAFKVSDGTVLKIWSVD